MLDYVVSTIMAVAGGGGDRSAAGIRAGPSDRYSDDQPLVSSHRFPVAVPVGMLTRHPPVIIDEDVHSVREMDELGGAVDDDPLAEEPVGEHAQRRARITSKVLGLDRGFAGTDEDPALGIDGRGDR